MELLLPNCLAHLDSVSNNRIYSLRDNNTGKHGKHIALFVDHILDTLCGCHQYKQTSSSSYMKDRPILASTVASLLRELESMFCPGRLSLSSNSRLPSTTRIDTLLRQCLLPALSSRKLVEMNPGTAPNNRVQLDSIPPLVYQICLFVTRIEACRDAHRMLCLAGIADTFDSFRFQFDEHFETDRANIYTEQVLRWTESTVLTHIGNTMRQTQDFGKVLLKLIKTGGNLNERGSPFRFQRLSRFRCALVLTVASSLPRMKVDALVLLRDLMVEEQTIHLKAVRNLITI